MTRWLRVVGIADIILLLVMAVTIGGAWVIRREGKREAAENCYCWLGAASTPRDTLWITVLRPECAALLPSRHIPMEAK